ncbi:MAG: hypothetical protein QM490_00975 [Candidatus Gracilibacteria bacterium]
MNLEELKKENLALKRKLSIAKLWMEKEIKAKVTKIAKGKVSNMTSKTKDVFFAENIEDIITKKVADYFGEIMLLNTPGSVIENIISAEISYYNLRKNSGADGLGVITSYHKSLDTLVESLITKGFRKFAKKTGQTQLRQNDVLEKALNSVVNKGYILSIGRLFHLVHLIKTDDILYDYGRCFRDYLEKYKYISDILLNDKFYINFEKLVGSEILGKKRHVGRISFKEAKEARLLLIGDFKEENSIIYKFIEIGKVDY